MSPRQVHQEREKERTKKRSSRPSPPPVHWGRRPRDDQECLRNIFVRKRLRPEQRALGRRSQPRSRWRPLGQGFLPGHRAADRGGPAWASPPSRGGCSSASSRRLVARRYATSCTIPGKSSPRPRLCLPGAELSRQRNLNLTCSVCRDCIDCADYFENGFSPPP